MKVERKTAKIFFHLGETVRRLTSVESERSVISGEWI